MTLLLRMTVSLGMTVSLELHELREVEDSEGTVRMRIISVAVWWVALIGMSGTALGQAKESVDLIVSGGIVVTMDGARNIYPDGSVAIKGDAIVAVGPRADIEARYRAAADDRCAAADWCCRGSSMGTRTCR